MCRTAPAATAGQTLDAFDLVGRVLLDAGQAAEAPRVKETEHGAPRGFTIGVCVGLEGAAAPATVAELGGGRQDEVRGQNRRNLLPRTYDPFVATGSGLTFSWCLAREGLATHRRADGHPHALQLNAALEAARRLDVLAVAPIGALRGTLVAAAARLWRPLLQDRCRQLQDRDPARQSDDGALQLALQPRPRHRVTARASNHRSACDAFGRPPRPRPTKAAAHGHGRRDGVSQNGLSQNG